MRCDVMKSEWYEDCAPSTDWLLSYMQFLMSASHINLVVVQNMIPNVYIPGEEAFHQTTPLDEFIVNFHPHTRRCIWTNDITMSRLHLHRRRVGHISVKSNKVPNLHSSPSLVLWLVLLNKEVKLNYFLASSWQKHSFSKVTMNINDIWYLDLISCINCSCVW